MADISSFLKKILEAIYGEEVRGSIHDALAAMNKESSSAMEFAATAKDSAKASAEKAKNEADTAGQKAAEALDSAGKAAQSETNAKASETAAEGYADLAVDAAERAGTSEENAKASEQTALQQAREAEESKNAAALSEAEAKAAEERAKEVRNQVETLGAQATADAAAAQEARTATEAARDAAKVSETNAKASETKAEDAKAGAEAAKEDALTAAQSKEDAEAARTAAEQAKADALDSAAEAAGSAAKAEQYSGKPPKPQNGTWWIWDAETGAYYDSHISCELQGPIGVGIQDIRLTKGDHSPGTTDIYTVHTTDGSTYTISVYNGLNGTGAGDVLGISFDLVIPAEGWSEGSVTIADERLLALGTHKYFLSADEACKEEFLDCNVQPKNITTSGFLTLTCDTEPAADLTVNLIRLELSGNGAIQ